MAMNMQQTKSRIKSVMSTQKITKAMELVSTSKLKKSKDINAKVTPFKNEVFEIMSYCAMNIDDKQYKYFNFNETDKELYIVISSSLGLCGGYNVNMEKYAASIIDKSKSDLLIIGTKALYYFKSKNYNIIDNIELPPLSLKENVSTIVSRNILSYFNQGKYRKISIIYTKFINSLTFEPVKVQLLPITIDKQTKKINKELLLEPSSQDVLTNLIPFYLEVALKTLLQESMLSEQASRRTAMETATDNASELQEKLLLEYNKSRQASITQEITEISGAANANK